MAPALVTDFRANYKPARNAKAAIRGNPKRPNLRTGRGCLRGRDGALGRPRRVQRRLNGSRRLRDNALRPLDAGEDAAARRPYLLIVHFDCHAYDRAIDFPARRESCRSS